MAATIEPARLFKFGIPADKTPGLAKQVRDNFEALARTNFTSDAAYPSTPQEGMLRVNAAPPNAASPVLEYYFGGAWRQATSRKLIVQVNPAAGVWTINHNFGTQPLVQIFDSTWRQLMVVPAGGAVTTTRPTTGDKNKAVAAPTVGDNANTALTIAATPALDGYVGVLVNGVRYALGDASKLRDCYFSGDGGATARAIAAITAGDLLYWNGVIAGFNLAVAHRIDFDYEVEVGAVAAGQYSLQHSNENTVVVTHPAAVAGYAVLIG